jgi:hypothetical protein
MASSDHDSDEDQSRDAVCDSRIADALRAAVRSLYEQDPDQVTPRQVRARVEKELDLEAQFLKSDSYWASKSKKIIQAEFVCFFPQLDRTSANGVHQEAIAEHPEAQTKEKSQPAEKKTPTKRAKKSVENKKIKGATENGDDGDEKAPEPKKRKRAVKGNKQKDAVVSDRDEAQPEGTAIDKPTAQGSELSDVQDSSHISTKAKRAAKPSTKRTKIQSKDRVEDDDSPAKNIGKPAAANGSDQSEAESEMSVVLDPSPPKKKSRSKSSPSEAKKGRIKKEKPAAKLKKGKVVLRTTYPLQQFCPLTLVRL